MTHLTARQSEVLKVIQDLLTTYGYPPTVNEIARQLNIGANAAYDHLRALRKAGKVDWTARKARTLRILQ